MTGSNLFCERIESLLKDPLFVPLSDQGLELFFQKTESRPSWALATRPPGILDTLVEWKLTDTQAEFGILVLDHFHNTIEGRDVPQLMALCKGAPGTRKSQTMLSIIWHMSQHRPHKALREELATCAYTGGAAMLISTPYTLSMTTCRQFQIDLQGPIRSSRSVHTLINRTACLRYVFIDEFSFLSYQHLKDISDQITVGLGERAEKDKPLGGMNVVFFGDYEQLSKSGDYAMYHGAAAEESQGSDDMKTWFVNEMDLHMKNTSYDPSPTFIGRNLWTSINTIRTLTVQKRQADTEAGRRLIARCLPLRTEDFPDEFFDDIQNKATRKDQLTSSEWSSPLYIVMRHNLRVNIDFKEAKYQAHRRSKRFIRWNTVDTILGKPLQDPLQLIVDGFIIDKIPRFQYFYEGMPIAFIDNKYFAAGNATNNIGYIVSIALDPREPPNDFSKSSRELLHLPAYVLVHVPNTQVTQLYPNLPPKVIPVTPSHQYHRLRLGDNRYKMANGKKITTVSISRLGMRWIGVHAVTQYFSQGMSLAGRKCIIDLRIPQGGGPLNDFAESILVMLSRHKDDDDWALLYHLWTPGHHIERAQVIDRMRKLLHRKTDLKVELTRVQLIEDNVTEPALQRILSTRKDLSTYFHKRSVNADQGV